MAELRHHEFPTTREIAQKIIGQLPDFPKSFIAPLAYAVGGLCSLLYRIITWHSQQRFISTCAGTTVRLGAKRVNPLIEKGKEYGLAPKASVATELNVQVRGKQAGRLDAGLRLLHAPTRTMYRIVFPVQVQGAGETALVRVVAIERPTEADLERDAPLSFVDYSRPVANLVERSAVVDSVSRSGTAPETLEEFRKRLLRRARSRPGGGNYADYRLWAESVPGVARCYPYSGLPGWVFLYVEGPGGRPVSADQLEAVERATRLSDDGTVRRPIGAKVLVERIRHADYRVTLQLQGQGDAEPIRGLIAAVLRERISIMENWILGLDPDDSPRSDILDVRELLSLAHPIARTRDGESRLASITLQRLEGLEPRLTEPLEQIRLARGQKARLESVVIAP